MKLLSQNLFIDKVVGLVKTVGFKRYFAHASWNIVGKVLNTAIAFFVNIYIVRYLGPDNYGFLSYAVSFAGIFSFLSGLGIDGLLYVDLVRYPDKKDQLLGTAFALRLFGAVITFFALIVALIFTNNGSNFNIAILVIACANFFNSFNIINSYFQASVFSKPTVLLSVFTSLGLSILKILLVIFKLNIFFFVSIFLLESIIAMFGNIYIYKKTGGKIFNWHFDYVLSKNLLLKSWPLMLSSASILIYSRIDQIIIKHMIDQVSVGVYDVAVRLAETWYSLPMIIVGSIFPAIINAGHVNDEHRDNRLLKLYCALFYFSVFFILPISLFSSKIIYLFYGEKFIGSGLVLSIYIWGGIGVSIGSVVNQYLISQKYTKISFLLNFVNMVVNIILNIILIPKYGINGAAIATLVSYTVFPFTIIFFKKTRQQAVLIFRAILLKGVLYGK